MIVDTAGVDHGANLAQMGGAEGWVVMKAGQPVAKAACPECSAPVLPGLDQCPKGHTIVKEATVPKTPEELEAELATAAEALAKAATDLADRDTRLAELEAQVAKGTAPVETEAEALAKAMEGLPEPVRAMLAKQAADAADAVQKAETATADALVEKNARLEREFVDKAAGFDGLAIAAGEFGPVLRAAAETMPPEQFAKLETVLRAASDTLKASDLLVEVGAHFTSAGAASAYEAIEKAAVELTEFKEGGISKEQAVDRIMETRQDLVAAYRKER